MGLQDEEDTGAAEEPGAAEDAIVEASGEVAEGAEGAVEAIPEAREVAVVSETGAGSGGMAAQAPTSAPPGIRRARRRGGRDQEAAIENVRRVEHDDTGCAASGPAVCEALVVVAALDAALGVLPEGGARRAAHGDLAVGFGWT